MPWGVTRETKPGCSGPAGEPAVKLKVCAVDVGVSVTVDHDIVEPERRQRGQVRVGRQAAVVLKGQQCHLLVGNQNRAAAGKKVEAQRERMMPDDQLADADVVNCVDLAGDPVAEPQAALVSRRAGLGHSAPGYGSHPGSRGRTAAP